MFSIQVLKAESTYILCNVSFRISQEGKFDVFT